MLDAGPDVGDVGGHSVGVIEDPQWGGEEWEWRPWPLVIDQDHHLWWAHDEYYEGAI